MVKIIINGEAHNSSYAPEIAVRDLNVLTAAGKKVICAVEDPELTAERLAEGAEGRRDFVENVENMAKAITLLKAKNLALYERIISAGDRTIAFSKDEMSVLESLLDESGLRADIDDPIYLVGAIVNFDNDLIPFGGYKRAVNYAKFSDRLIATDNSVEVVVIDDLEAAAEVYHLQTIDRRRGVSEAERIRLDALLKDQAIEEARTSTMAKKIFDKAKTLPKDGVVYVYPIGNSHVAAVAQKLTELGIKEGTALEIHASCLWDKREDRDALLAVSGMVAEVGMRNLFLSEPRCGGYDELISGIFPDVRFPELKPSLSPEFVSGKSAVEEVATVAGAGAGKGGGAAGGGRY